MNDETVTLNANHAALVTRMLIVGMQCYAEVQKSVELAKIFNTENPNRVPDCVIPIEPTGDMSTPVDFCEALTWMHLACNPPEH